MKIYQIVHRHSYECMRKAGKMLAFDAMWQVKWLLGSTGLNEWIGKETEIDLSPDAVCPFHEFMGEDDPNGLAVISVRRSYLDNKEHYDKKYQEMINNESIR